MNKRPIIKKLFKNSKKMVSKNSRDWNIKEGNNSCKSAIVCFDGRKFSDERDKRTPSDIHLFMARMLLKVAIKTVILLHQSS